PADGVVRRAVGNDHAVGAVAPVEVATGVQADEVAADLVAGRRVAGDEDADGGVGGDDVAGRGRRAADHVVRPVRDHDAAAEVPQRRDAVGAEADEVAGQHVAAALHHDAVAVVARDDVALGGVGEPVGVGADAVAGARAAADPDAALAVAPVDQAGRVGAD